MKGLIYKATDVIDGRVYIGQTMQGLARRKNEHYKDAQNGDENYFHTALRERGFEWSILDEFEGDKGYVIHCLNVAEEYQILKHRSNEQKYGYNSTKGGYSSDKFAEHIRMRMREKSGAVKILQYSLDGTYIDAYESLSAVCAKFNVPKLKRDDLLKGSWHGYMWKLDSGVRDMFIDPYSPNDGHGTRIYVDVYSTESGKKVDSHLTAEEASIKYSRSRCSILESSKRNTGDCYKVQECNLQPYMFIREENAPKAITVEVIRKKEHAPSKPVNHRAVIQYDMNGDFIARYESVGEASLATGKDATTIRRCCAKKGLVVVYEGRNSSVWRFADDTSEMPEIKVYVAGGKVREKKMKHTIEQYSLDGEFIAKYETVREASEASGVNTNTINACLYGHRSKKAKFIWKR